jgi:DNA-binding NtrC family response regulator
MLGASDIIHVPSDEFSKSFVPKVNLDASKGVLMETTQAPRVLIVEDDYHISRIIEVAMTELDVPYVYDTALSAEEALEKWQAQGYDVLVTDYNLRGMNGITLINELHSLGARMNIIMVSAYDTPQLQRAAMAAGVSVYMPKPFMIDELIEVIRRFLSKTERAVNLS